MGSGRDKRKAAKEKKAGPTAGKGADKTERKTHKNEVCPSAGEAACPLPTAGRQYRSPRQPHTLGHASRRTHTRTPASTTTATACNAAAQAREAR
jgi:hypothetical protein